MVVGVKPGLECGAPSGFGSVGECVGPLIEQGAVEPLDFSVGLGPVGADALVGDPGGGQGVAPGERPVARAVVGHDPLDDDSGGGVKGAGAVPERDGGVLALI